MQRSIGRFLPSRVVITNLLGDKMKTLTSTEIHAIQDSVPGIEVFAALYAVVSTNCYDNGTTFHALVGSEEEGLERIAGYKALGWSVNFKVVTMYGLVKN